MIIRSPTASRAFLRHGATLAFTYQGEALGKRVKPLAQELGSNLVLPCDAEDISTVDQVFARLEYDWGDMDFLVHSIAYSDKSELRDSTQTQAERISFARLSFPVFPSPKPRACVAKLMKNGGSLLTVSFGGGTHVMPNYNVMGVAKAASYSSCAILPPTSAIAAFASMRCRPARCAPWRAPASRARGRWAPFKKSIVLCVG